MTHYSPGQTLVTKLAIFAISTSKHGGHAVLERGFSFIRKTLHQVKEGWTRVIKQKENYTSFVAYSKGCIL